MSAETRSWNGASGFLQCHFPQKTKRQMIQVGTSWFVSFNFSYLGYFPSQQFQIDFSVFAATAPVFNDGCVSVSWEGRRKWSFIWIWHPELPNSCPTKSALIWRTGQKVTLHVCLFRAGRSGQLEMWVVLDSGGKHVTFYNPGISAGNVRISSKAIYAF